MIIVNFRVQIWSDANVSYFFRVCNNVCSVNKHADCTPHQPSHGGAPIASFCVAIMILGGEWSKFVKPRGHVLRAGFHARLEQICRASAEKIEAAILALGPSASIKDVLRAPEVDPDVKAALSELMVFTADVLGVRWSPHQITTRANWLCFNVWSSWRFFNTERSRH